MSNNLLFIDDENDILKNYMALFNEHMESVKNMNKGEGPDIYQRDHFKRKIRDLLEPEIEKEEMLLSSTIADMTESAEKNLAKKPPPPVITIL